MDQLFRFPEATRNNPAIELWFQQRPDALAAIARKYFLEMRKCGKDIRELIHDGCPVACVGEVAFAYVNIFKAHVNVGFYRGAELSDPKKLLIGTGKFMRHVKLQPTVSLDTEALLQLIDTAYKDMKSRI